MQLNHESHIGCSFQADISIVSSILAARNKSRWLLWEVVIHGASLSF